MREDQVHPELRAVFLRSPGLSLEDLNRVRKASLEAVEPYEDAAILVRDRWVPGPPNDPDVLVRIYAPRVLRSERLPCVLWIHGGGYILGSMKQENAICQRLVWDLGCVVVSVDYRLAPENPFPAGLQDCYAALQWTADHALELGIDASRLAVAGNSAGGGLTAALALLCRDRGGPKICFQMPLYPMIDDRHRSPSSRQITDSRVWNRQHNLTAWSMYLGKQPGGDDVSPYAAPARAVNLAGLPPGYTCVGELDVFRDETIEYVARLNQAGVPTELHVYPGCFHGFEFSVPDAAVSQRAQAEYIAALGRGLEEPSSKE